MLCNQYFDYSKQTKCSNIINNWFSKSNALVEVCKQIWHRLSRMISHSKVTGNESTISYIPFETGP